ncbi:MAG: hypothetical protein J3K34DRAFT_456622 [Monoraphidium minutum]|nr:MAG: hypothetical protein J3K34DRAFT_456622 [Monoraphidium minutum]
MPFEAPARASKRGMEAQNATMAPVEKRPRPSGSSPAKAGGTQVVLGTGCPAPAPALHAQPAAPLAAEPAASCNLHAGRHLNMRDKSPLVPSSRASKRAAAARRDDDTGSDSDGGGAAAAMPKRTRAKGSDGSDGGGSDGSGSEGGNNRACGAAAAAAAGLLTAEGLERPEPFAPVCHGISGPVGPDPAHWRRRSPLTERWDSGNILLQGGLVLSQPSEDDDAGGHQECAYAGGGGAEAMELDDAIQAMAGLSATGAARRDSGGGGFFRRF